MSLMRLLTSGKTLVGLQDARPHYRMADSRSMPKFGSAKNPIRNAQKSGEKAPAEKPAELRQPELASLKSLEAVRPDRDDERRRRDGPLTPTLSPADGEREKLQAGLETSGQQDNRTTGLREHSTVSRREGPKDNKGANGDEAGVKASGENSLPTATKAGPARLDRSSFWLREWAERFGSWLPLRARPARSAARSIPMQQGELSLSLDHVRVVRNDLSDCDVEFVAKKPKAEKQKSECEMTGLEGSRTNEREDEGREAADGQASEVERMTAWGRATRLFGASFMRSGTEETVS